MVVDGSHSFLTKSMGKVMNKTELKEIPEIRTIKRKDRKLVTRLFLKVIEETQQESVKNLFDSKKQPSGKKTKESNKKSKQSTEEEWGIAISEIAVNIIKNGLELFDDDFGAWFADLLGISLEEFDELPMNVESNIIKQIRTAPEAVDFFTECFQGAKMTTWLETPLRVLKEQFGSIFASEKENLENSPT